MEKKLVVPRLRPEMEDAVLCAWLKEDGDSVEAGEPVYEIETDKVVVQVEASCGGVLKKRLCEEGDTVKAEQAVAVIEERRGRERWRDGEETGLAEGKV